MYPYKYEMRHESKYRIKLFTNLINHSKFEREYLSRREQNMKWLNDWITRVKYSSQNSFYKAIIIISIVPFLQVDLSQNFNFIGCF